MEGGASPSLLMIQHELVWYTIDNDDTDGFCVCSIAWEYVARENGLCWIDQLPSE